MQPPCNLYQSCRNWRAQSDNNTSTPGYLPRSCGDRKGGAVDTPTPRGTAVSSHTSLTGYTSFHSVLVASVAEWSGMLQVLTALSA